MGIMPSFGSGGYSFKPQGDPLIRCQASGLGSATALTLLDFQFIM